MDVFVAFALKVECARRVRAHADVTKHCEASKKYISLTQVVPPRASAAARRCRLRKRRDSCAFGGPDVILQPVHQRQVVGAAQQRHRAVRVRIDGRALRAPASAFRAAGSCAGLRQPMTQRGRRQYSMLFESYARRFDEHQPARDYQQINLHSQITGLELHEILPETDMANAVNPIIWDRNRLRLLDQRLLPAEVVYLDCLTAKDVAEAIHGMAVRGAPAIGIAAAYGLVLSVQQAHDSFDLASEVLAASRPTAVNLRWALERMRGVWLRKPDVATLEAEAIAIHDEDLAQNLKMGELGAELLPSNATSLPIAIPARWQPAATACAGRDPQRLFTQSHHPCLQHRNPSGCGARLTAWELQQEGHSRAAAGGWRRSAPDELPKIDWVIVGRRSHRCQRRHRQQDWYLCAGGCRQTARRQIHGGGAQRHLRSSLQQRRRDSHRGTQRQ